MEAHLEADAAREEKLAVLLGWASLGLGLPQTLSPGRFDHLIGIKPTARSRAVTLLACGVRELAAAAGILALERPRPVKWVSARLAGDALDLALLVVALKSKPKRPGRTGAAIGAVVGISAADLYTAVRLRRRPDGSAEDQLKPVSAAITVRRQPEEVYEFWRQLENLPSFMHHLESVEEDEGGRSRWKAKAPVGSVRWDAEILEDRPNELIAWRSLDGAKVENSGSVRFEPAPGDRGTEIVLEMRYEAPGGALGAVLAKLFGEEPQQQAKDDLRRFKQVMETGQVVRSDGSPEGQNARRHLKQRPAQPPADNVGEETETSFERSPS